MREISAAPATVPITVTANESLAGDTSSASGASSVSAEDDTRQSDRQGNLLAFISRMTGLDNDILVHEMCINPLFRLPPNEVDPRSISVSWRMSRTAGPAQFKVLHTSSKTAIQSATSTSASISLGAIESFDSMPEGSPRAGRTHTHVAQRPLTSVEEGECCDYYQY